jgi:MHS family proline/betaine transporter-like MFS transporter
MAQGSYLYALLGVMALAIVGGGVSAVAAVSTAEQFISQGRLSGLALGSSSATALFGGLAPYIAQRLIDKTGLAWLPGALIAGVATVVLPVLWTMPETHPMKAKQT